MIQQYTKNFLLIFPAIILTTSSLFSQLPGWRTVTDRDGNRFHVDTRGKIRTSGKPDNSFQTVSIEGLDYYLNQGIELINQHHIPEGLTLLKSILALPRNDDRIFHAQSRAAGEINRIKRREGPRFLKYDEKSSLILIRADDKFSMTNLRMKYSITIPYHATVIRETIRNRLNYRYSGILMGIVFKKPEPAHGNVIKQFDALLAIDSEEFKSIISHVATLKKHRENLLGEDIYSRTMVHSQDDAYIFRITADRLQGFEGYYVRGHLGYLVRIIAPANFTSSDEKKIVLFLKNFKY